MAAAAAGPTVEPMDTRPVTVSEAARQHEEIWARCAEANAHAAKAVERAEAALVASRERLQRAQATLDAIRVPTAGPD